VCAALCAQACGGGKGDAGGGKLVVVASIFPLYDLCRRVAGDAAEVKLLLPPGKSEHDFDPTPADVKNVADAKLAFLVGLEMDEWLVKTVEASGGGATVVRLGEKVVTRPFYAPLLGTPDDAKHDEFTDTAAPASGAPDSAKPGSAGPKGAPGKTPASGAGASDAPAPGSGAPAASAAAAPAPAGDEHGEEHEHEHHHGGGPDPHIWMSVVNAIKMVDAMAAAMSTAAPASKEVFTANAVKLKDELTKLNDEVKTRTAAFTKKGFVTFHGSFGYFADAYGLDILAVIEPSPGKEPSAAYLKDVLEFIKGKPIGALYIEPQLDPKPGEVLAKEAGLPLLTLDPIGGRPESDSYDKLIRYNLDSLEKSMK
jgi:ABC-type Zn uptake system ZnuABC Zn-binding protein ZnuA